MSSSKAFGNPPISDQLRKPLTRQVVRIEAGMVIVDTKDVDQEVGKDLDPEHEKAEVEDGRVVVVVSKEVSRIYGMVKISTMKNDDHGEDYAVDVVADGLYG